MGIIKFYIIILSYSLGFLPPNFVCKRNLVKHYWQVKLPLYKQEFDLFCQSKNTSSPCGITKHTNTHTHTQFYCQRKYAHQPRGLQFVLNHQTKNAASCSSDVRMSLHSLFLKLLYLETPILILCHNETQPSLLSSHCYTICSSWKCMSCITVAVFVSHNPAAIP